MKKRGQIQSKVVVYALIIIAAAFILLFGVVSLKKVGEKSREVEMERLKLSLKTDIESNVRYGKVADETYSVPSDIAEICFYDSGLGENGEVSELLEKRYPLIAGSVKSDIKKNIFFVNDNREIEDSMFVDKMSVSGPLYSCKKVISGVINVKLFGQGASAQISEFEKRVTVDETKLPLTIELDGVEGLSLKIPEDDDLDGKTIVFKVEKLEDGTDGISDLISIHCNECEGEFNPPLELTIQLPEGVNCDEGSGEPKFVMEPTGGGGEIPFNPICIDDNTAMYKISSIQ